MEEAPLSIGKGYIPFFFSSFFITFIILQCLSPFSPKKRMALNECLTPSLLRQLISKSGGIDEILFYLSSCDKVYPIIKFLSGFSEHLKKRLFFKILRVLIKSKKLGKFIVNENESSFSLNLTDFGNREEEYLNQKITFSKFVKNEKIKEEIVNSIVRIGEGSEEDIISFYKLLFKK